MTHAVTTMQHHNHARRRDETLKLLPFASHDNNNNNFNGDDSAQTLVDSMKELHLSCLKPVQDEFLEFLQAHQQSQHHHGGEDETEEDPLVLSQHSLSVNDSALDRTFEAVYDQGKVLGEGGFAFVYQCQHKQNGHHYAVKEVLKNEGNGTAGQEIKNELMALKLVKESPYFVRLWDVFDTPDRTWLILEEMKGGDLLDKLTELEVYEEWEARKVARTLLEAVAYLHKRQVCHRDIKPENILLPRADDPTYIKLADLGCAHHWHQDNEMMTLCGSPQYVAPEVIGDQRPDGVGYGSQCDLWSCGVVLYILLGGYAPFESEDEEELLDLICHAEYEFHEEYWNDITEPPMSLIQQLLEVNPRKRLTAPQALSSTWLRRRDGDWIKELSSKQLSGMSLGGDSSHHNNSDELSQMNNSSSSASTFGAWLEKRESMRNVMGGYHQQQQPSRRHLHAHHDQDDSEVIDELDEHYEVDEHDENDDDDENDEHEQDDTLEKGYHPTDDTASTHNSDDQEPVPAAEAAAASLMRESVHSMGSWYEEDGTEEEITMRSMEDDDDFKMMEDDTLGNDSSLYLRRHQRTLSAE